MGCRKLTYWSKAEVKVLTTGKTEKNACSHYELTNHLSNVLSVVTDRRTGVCGTDTSAGGDTLVAFYQADIISAQDYYPFGMQQPGRKFSSSGYRFGFNGMEMDNEVYGDANAYNFGARIYDARLGRWLSVDPLFMKYPAWSPYVSFNDNPIFWTDPTGMGVDWEDNGDGTYTAEAGDGAESLAEDAGISREKAYKLMEEQGYGTYTDPNDGVVKSAVDPGDVVTVSQQKSTIETSPSNATGANNSFSKAEIDNYEWQPIERNPGLEPVNFWANIFFVPKISFSVGKMAVRGAGRLIFGRAAAKGGIKITKHAAKRMAQRGITNKMVKKGISKGTKYFDPKNGTINYILKNGFASGKDLLIGVSRQTNKVTTVIRGNNLIKKRFILQ